MNHTFSGHPVDSTLAWSMIACFFLVAVVVKFVLGLKLTGYSNWTFSVVERFALVEPVFVGSDYTRCLKWMQWYCGMNIHIGQIINQSIDICKKKNDG